MNSAICLDLCARLIPPTGKVLITNYKDYKDFNEEHYNDMVDELDGFNVISLFTFFGFRTI